jgi:hypothetical protein
VADTDGNPVSWIAYTGPAKLPSFIHSLPTNSKFSTSALIRMETPVIYFYASARTTVSVKVDLPSGNITEWYPEVTGYSGISVDWRGIEVLPGETLIFPSGSSGSHYYAARATDAAPLRVGKEQEKLLFYRGLANFNVPLRALYTSDGKIDLRVLGGNAVPTAIVFENRGGRIGYRVLRELSDCALVERPELSADVPAIRRELADSLVEDGLYPKEAEAMLETWRDSWFEEGARVLYLFPRAAVDRVLPLTISPVPQDVQRVFVGRVEMLSPEAKDEIVTAAARHDRATLAKYGRFLEPFCKLVGQAVACGL